MTKASLRRMCKLYKAWCEAHKLPHISADELLHEDILNHQRVWLSRFINAWERWPEWK